MAIIRDLMTSNVETVGPDHTAKDAAAFMLSADTGSIPVCDGEKVIGMITDRDIAVRGVAAGKGPECSVRDVMTSDVVFARDTDDPHAIAMQMSTAQVRRLAVLDANDKLVGMISLGDLSREADEAVSSQALEGVSAK